MLRQNLFSREHWKFTKKTLGKDHSDVTKVLENMADFREEIRKKDEAEKLEKCKKDSLEKPVMVFGYCTYIKHKEIK